MITDADVKKLESTFATKEELEKLDSRTAEGFADVQSQLNDVKGSINSLSNRVESLEQRILTMDDHITGALNNLIIENKVTATYRPKIENHEQRITKVESVVFAN